MRSYRSSKTHPMTIAEQLSKPDGLGRFVSHLPWPDRETVDRFVRSPRMTLSNAARRLPEIHVDRVRAKPALSPSLAMNLGMGAIGLGLWGLLFPRHVKRTLGVRSPVPVVRLLFGVRELITGFTLASDPTRSDMLWARVAGDAFDLVALKALDRPTNPSRGGARFALGAVVLITALDVIAAVRMSNGQRNCPTQDRMSTRLNSSHIP